MARAVPHVFSIAPGQDFAQTLIEALFAGKIFDLPFADDPLLLADLVIYVPTQRVRRIFETSFARYLAPKPVILPRIRPLAEPGDLVEHLMGIGEEDAPSILSEKRRIEPFERRFLLLAEIRRWRARVAARRQSDAPGQALGASSSLTECLALADALGRVIDEMRIDDVPLSTLASVEPDAYDPARFDEYWSLTRDFLRVAAQVWPDMLGELTAEDAMTLRIQQIELEARRLARLDGKQPILVAGSTGSVRATAKLMRAISRLDHGAVILPGLDQQIGSSAEFADDAWERIAGAESSFATRFAHPQVSLKRTLDDIGLPREAVRVLGHAGNARNRFISEVLRPAETSALWHKTRVGFPMMAALDGIRVIESHDEREEALAIAILMRETLENPQSSVALVTADRALAQRVKCELARWAIDAEDSAGTSLAQSAPGMLLRLMLSAAQQRNGVSILALLRHPLVRLGQEATLLPGLVDALELIVFRGRSFRPDLDLMTRVVSALSDRDKRLSAPAKRIGEPVLAALPAFAHLLDDVLAPFTPERDDQPLQVLAEAMCQTILALNRNADGDCAIETNPAFGMVKQIFDDVARHGQGVTLAPSALPDLMEGLLAERIAPGSTAGHPRAAILGLLESRLIHVDRVILGGMNEGSFPPSAAGDPFLNRAMRLSLGLQPPERRIGQSAHDLTMLAGHTDLVLTRSRRTGGQPGIPSRFLRRMEAFAGEECWSALCNAGEITLEQARALDQPGPFSPIDPPVIIPEGRRIPHKLSITEIETLRRDPYAIYAKHILNIEPLEPLDPAPDARDRGTILHHVLETYARSDPPSDPETAEQRLRDLGADAFRPIAHEAELFHFWWQTFEAIIPGFVAFDRARREAGLRLFLEARADFMLGLPSGDTIRLTGKADRIELDAQGNLDIFDYKSGAPPSTKTVLSGRAPQLTLTAALAEKGAFAALPSGVKTAGIAYLPIGGKAEVLPKPILGKAVALADLIQTDWQKLITDLSAYSRGEKAYRSRVATQSTRHAGDYDHLARVGEWSLASADEAEIGEDEE